MVNTLEQDTTCLLHIHYQSHYIYLIVIFYPTQAQDQYGCAWEMCGFQFIMFNMRLFRFRYFFETSLSSFLMFFCAVHLR